LSRAQGRLSVSETETSIVSGPTPFAAFMERALYDETTGFYATGGQAGRRGDFLTSPEVGPLFGAVVARALDAWWVELGRPPMFTVIEAGAGPGTLARAAFAAAPDCLTSLRYVMVERSATQRSKHPVGEPFESRADLPTDPVVGVVIANELLDNLPFDLLVYDSAWREAWVEHDRDGRALEVLRPANGLPPGLPVQPAHGARAPRQRAAAEWVEQARSLVTVGRVVAIDYTSSTVSMAARPWREWLRTYREHERGGHYLTDVGRQDITCDVAIDQLPEPDVVRTQAQWLQLHGINELVEAGRSQWLAEAAQPTLASMKARSRIREAESLLDLAGLGGFTVMEWQCP
jgi:SAM-dependent MidA family methyltransferase